MSVFVTDCLLALTCVYETARSTRGNSVETMGFERSIAGRDYVSRIALCVSERFIPRELVRVLAKTAREIKNTIRSLIVFETRSRRSLIFFPRGEASESMRRSQPKTFQTSSFSPSLSPPPRLGGRYRQVLTFCSPGR